MQLRFRKAAPPGFPPGGAFTLYRRIQHILNENPIPRSRVIHQNMGHSTDKLPILYNRAAGHG